SAVRIHWWTHRYGMERGGDGDCVVLEWCAGVAIDRSACGEGWRAPDGVWIGRGSRHIRAWQAGGRGARPVKPRVAEFASKSIGRFHPMNARMNRVAIVVIALFIAISALAGGIGLVGGGLQFPPEWLNGTP